MTHAPAEREGRLAGAGVELFARWVGDGGPTVVALHGGPGASHDYLRPQFDLLARGRTILYYDQRGGGRSPVPRDVPLGWREHVADLTAVAAAAGPPLTLLGFSWGGLLALLFAAEHPELVRRLALVAPAGTHAAVRARFEETFATRQAAPEIAAERAALSGSGLRERDPDAFWRRAFELSVAGYFKDPTRARSLTPFRVASRAQQAVWQSLEGLDLRPRLPAVAGETLILHGRYDPVPLESSEEIARSMPHARLVVFEDSGHALYAEETARFVEVLDSFLPGSR
ncbi:MAG TPA: alpha/beta fold hydrolase [Gemmatimonadales bacterium]|nr:alpha/beta fold hydrolase [Gemmatimonadales bacterium]